MALTGIAAVRSAAVTSLPLRVWPCFISRFLIIWSGDSDPDDDNFFSCGQLSGSAKDVL